MRSKVAQFPFASPPCPLLAPNLLWTSLLRLNGGSEMRMANLIFFGSLALLISNSATAESHLAGQVTGRATSAQLVSYTAEACSLAEICNHYTDSPSTCG